MHINHIVLENPFVAAPMAGVSSPAFRLMARRGGASLVYTEMVSAAGLVRDRPRTRRLLTVLEEERPLSVQIFGADPEVIYQASRLVSSHPVDILDLNLGCPAKKVRRQGAGSALLDDPVRAAEVVSAAVQGSSLPVTVKLRLGYKKNDLENILPGIIKAGIAALCLHARTVSQGFGGQADWEAIASLKKWCPLPVIGNGDAASAAEAVRLLQTTGCDAVMIGRAAMGDPWIFGRAADRLARRPVRKISLEERRQALSEHVLLAQQLGGQGHALHFMRKFMMWYTRGLPGASAFRRAAGPAQDLQELWRLSVRYFEGLKEVA